MQKFLRKGLYLKGKLVGDGQNIAIPATQTKGPPEWVETRRLGVLEPPILPFRDTLLSRFLCVNLSRYTGVNYQKAE